jgi:hypothetical protein
MSKNAREIMARDGEPTWSDVFGLLQSKEGRRVLTLGYRLLLGYETLPDRELTETEKARNYEEMIVKPVSSRRHVFGKSLAKIAVNLGSLSNLVEGSKEELSAAYVDGLAVESMKPKHPEVSLAELPTSTPLPEAA